MRPDQAIEAAPPEWHTRVRLTGSSAEWLHGEQREECLHRIDRMDTVSIDTAHHLRIYDGRSNYLSRRATLNPVPGRYGQAFQQIDADVGIEQKSGISHA